MIPTHRRLEYANGYLLLGMVREAGEELGHIRPDDRRKPEVLAAMVHLYLAQGNWESMAEAAECMSDDAPEEAQGWVHWVYALRELQQVKEAREAIKRDRPILCVPCPFGNGKNGSAIAAGWGGRQGWGRSL